MSPALAQGVLAEEQHEASPILIQRTAVLLHQPNAFDDVGQLNLFVPRKLRKADLGEALVDGDSNLL